MKYSIKVNEVRAKEGSNIKGFATVVFGDSFKITNIAILENKDKGELFVSMPRYRSNERDESNGVIYKDVCNPITAEFREELYTNILDAYARIREPEKEETQKRDRIQEMPEFSVTVTPYEREGSNIKGLARIYFENSFIVNNINIAALWILVANSWMQYPVGMKFDPETARNVMDDFWALVLSPVAVNKFFHAVSSGWVLGGIFVVGVSAWYLIKNRENFLARNSIRVGAWVGLIGTLVVAYTGDGSAYQVADKQPMKLAAMEGVYNGKNGQELIAFGILNPDKKYDNDEKEFLFDIPIPKLLSILATREIDGFVPGINDIINGGYVDKNLKGEEIIALSAQEKMERGRLAIAALADFNTARKDNDTEAMNEAKARLEANYEYFGYGYIDSVEQLIPHVPFVFYSFHIMIILGGYFLLFFIFILVLSYKEKLQKLKWVLWIAVLTIPLGYVCLESGWIVAEMGRQPWVIQDIMPTFAAISNIEVASVQTTFWMFAVLFTVLLIAEVGIMLKQIKKGTEQK